MYVQKVISKKIVFCWRLEGQGRKWQDPEPDPSEERIHGSGSVSKCHGSTIGTDDKNY
jgi:hypothetical protein